MPIGMFVLVQMSLLLEILLKTLVGRVLLGVALLTLLLSIHIMISPVCLSEVMRAPPGPFGLTLAGGTEGKCLVMSDLL
jgi:hypothetical protein